MSETASTADPVLTERRDRILIVTINRPEAKNAVNAAVSHGLAAAMDVLDEDPGLSVGILTGAGGSFCAGMDLKATELLTTVASEEEAIEISVAFVQLYRENAKYLDRPYKWIAKVGLDWVKARVVDDLAERAALVARFDHSQTIYQKDPWAERAQGGSRHEFTPLADFSFKEAAE